MSTRKQFPVLLNVDISETTDSYLISADVTGFSAESVNVSAWQDSLVVNMSTGHEPGQSYYLGEVEPEHYRRVIPLGFAIGDDDFYSKYNSVTLDIIVKKPQAVQPTIAESNNETAA